jgi:hypothetical protein
MFIVIVEIDVSSNGEAGYAVYGPAQTESEAEQFAARFMHRWRNSDGIRAYVQDMYPMEVPFLKDGFFITSLLPRGQESYVSTEEMRPDVKEGTRMDADEDAFWAGQAGDRSDAVVIGHLHYRVKPDLNGRPGMAGFDGDLFSIRMLATGEVIQTRNLWHQGEIPPQWWERLPDDAEFVPGPGPGFYPPHLCEDSRECRICPEGGKGAET